MLSCKNNINALIGGNAHLSCDCVNKTLEKLESYFDPEKQLAKEQAVALERLEGAEGQGAALIIFNLAVEGTANKTFEALKTRFADKMAIKDGSGRDGWHLMHEFGGPKIRAEIAKIGVLRPELRK
jgi:hypothetical protein